MAMGLGDVFSSGGDRSKRFLPPDAPAILETFGRHEGPALGGDVLPGLELGQAVKKGLEVDPDRVLDEIVEACGAIGGWSYYGAWDILSAYAPDREQDPRYMHIVDGVLDTLREEGYGPGDIPRILVPRAIERDRAEQAASPQAASAPESEPEILALAKGERRLLKVIYRPDGNQNKIYLIHRRPCDDDIYSDESIRFVAVMHMSDDPDFDFETDQAWKAGVDEREVYIRLAEAYANFRTAQYSYWLEPSVQWFADRVR